MKDQSSVLKQLHAEPSNAWQTSEGPEPLPAGAPRNAVVRLFNTHTAAAVTITNPETRLSRPLAQFELRAPMELLLAVGTHTHHRHWGINE